MFQPYRMSTDVYSAWESTNRVLLWGWWDDYLFTMCYSRQP